MVNHNPEIGVGERIRRLRDSRGWDQPELARRIGVHRNTVSRWERDIQQPPARRLHELAEVLEVELTYLLTGVSERGGADTAPPAPGSNVPASPNVVGTTIVWLASIENALTRMDPILDVLEGAVNGLRGVIRHAQRDSLLARQLLHRHTGLDKASLADVEQFEEMLESSKQAEALMQEAKDAEDIA